jgi:hypothetical protein
MAINEQLEEIDQLAHDYICAMLSNPKFKNKSKFWIIKLAYEIANELMKRAEKEYNK